jgi:hypothetical protein
MHQNRGEVARRFGLWNVDRLHASDYNAILAYSGPEAMRATTSYSWASVIWAL